VLVGNLKTLTDLLLPDWDAERPASRARTAPWPADRMARATCSVTGIMLPARGAEQYIDNVLASPQGAMHGEKFERFDTGFVGSGDTLSARAGRAAGRRQRAAARPWARRWPSSTSSLDAGFRPGMGSVVPDRFFWALPPARRGRPRGRRRPAVPERGDDADERQPAKETARRVR
jgi:hydroxymethylpyrimidine/phosphomethylpyrimidine kinase